MKAKELILGTKLFFCDFKSAQLVTVTKLEDKGDCINVTVKGNIETIAKGVVETEGEFTLDRNADLWNDTFEIGYPFQGDVSSNFHLLKQYKIKVLRENKEDMIRKYDGHIAELEKIQEPRP